MGTTFTFICRKKIMLSATTLNGIVQRDAAMLNSGRLEAQYTTDILPEVQRNFDEIHSTIEIRPNLIANVIRYRFMQLPPFTAGNYTKNWMPNIVKQHAFLMAFLTSTLLTFMASESFAINFSPCLILTTEDDVRVSEFFMAFILFYFI